tara:strand:- start:457 stop:726 length:270 start_codon:yes stop_codon:yes gene_type:complete
MSNEIFDFGFTTVDENELDVIQQAQEKVANATSDTSALYKKLDKLYNSFAPLLNNLKKNPQKEYIYWPNRLDKIEQFESMIQQIYKEKI